MSKDSSVDRNVGRPIKQGRPAYTRHYPMLRSSLEKIGKHFILSPGITCSMDGDNQGLMVVEKFPPTLTWVSIRPGFTLVSCPEKGDDTE